ncbi:hypothetical protein BC829DRAFT_169906 [Chytridium lagenaria]|nr:hypothetical protein BC829DRAFT_169906 [Chytridium lagenaria]
MISTRLLSLAFCRELNILFECMLEIGSIMKNEELKFLFVHFRQRKSKTSTCYKIHRSNLVWRLTLYRKEVSIALFLPVSREIMRQRLTLRQWATKKKSHSSYHDQTIRGSSIHPSLSKIKRERKARGNTLTLSMHSRLGKFFDQYPSWRMEFSVWFEPGHLSRRRMCENDALLPPALVRKPDVFMSEEFDRSNGEWQSRVATVCFGDEVAVAQVVATGTIESF